MSMMLKTVNPQAAEAIESGPAKVGVGNMVVYHARAGYMRAGRTSFPAIVLDQQKNGDLNLLVILEREDIATEEYVPFQSHNQPHHCWSLVERIMADGGFTVTLPATYSPSAPDLAPLMKRIEALETRALETGGSPESAPSALDITMLTKRIEALEKAKPKKPAAGK